MISVVIPAYNAAPFIRRTIDSVLAQTYEDYEVIVVDDGSKDKTERVVGEYGGKVRCIRQENGGDGAARNTGIKAAAGDWIAFLDHDDEWIPEKLEKQVAYLEKHPELHWCGTNFYKACGDRRMVAGNTETLKRAIEGTGYFEDFFDAVARRGCALVTATMMVDRKVFDEVGLFETDWPLAADFDMWWRIAYRYGKLGYIPDPLATMHLGDLDTAGKKRHMRGKRGDEARRLVKKHLALAESAGCAERFKPMARQVLRNSLATTIYHGFKTNARETVRDFAPFFTRTERWGVYVLTVFPRITMWIVHAMAYMGHKLRLDRHVTRRWINSEEAADDRGES